MTYGRFLEYLEMGWVKQVDLYDNSRNAIVQASSPELGNRPQSEWKYLGASQHSKIERI
jgi:cell division protease FtsH